MPPEPEGPPQDGGPPASTRADARRNRELLVGVAAEAFVESGVDVPVREIARRAGVGVGTIYRHFPTRADLVVAVYRHQVEACADAGADLAGSAPDGYLALVEWIDLFVDFLVTKHGLARALHSDDEAFAALHDYFVERLVPACEALLRLAADQGGIVAEVRAYELLRAVGNLCIGADDPDRYEPRRMVAVLLRGLRPD